MNINSKIDTVWMVLVILGLGGVTVLTRSFFFLLPKGFQLSSNAQKVLRYAPIAAISAVIAPGLLMRENHLDLSWHNPAWMACLVSVLFYLWRPGFLMTILVGLLAFTGFRLWGV